MTEMNASGYILGLDIGSNSVGWAVLTRDETTGQPNGLAKVGVRVFQDDVNQGFETGREEPPGQKRREARGQRRRLDRRKRRLYRLARVLQEAGLLPPDEMNSPEDRHQFFTDLDEKIARELGEAQGGPVTLPKAAMLPYLLRAQALDKKLPLHLLGRALYHLAHRRGFLSNRRSAPKKDEDPKVVRQAITDLEQKIEEAGARTLGEFFSRLDPEEERIRRNWTSRQMYLDEFEKIWSSQEPHYPDALTGELKAAVQRAIFFQHPLKSSKHLIGKCELEPDRPRAPWGLLAAQRFRLIQRVNDTRLITPEGEIRALSPEERTALIDALESVKKLTFAQAKKGIGVSPRHVFNFEEGGEKDFPGNRTAGELKSVFGDRWPAFGRQEREAMVEDLLSMESEEALARRGMNAWGLSPEQAARFAAIQLEKGYCRHSRQALQKLLPYLEEGMSYMTTVKRVYGEKPLPEAEAALPLVEEAIPELRNSVVSRALTETRKVVNNLIRVYGQPATVRIELARDLKKGRQERKKITRQIRENQQTRLAATDEIVRQVQVATPSRTDVEKYLLAVECDFTCPYTGRSFSMLDLFGPAPQVDVEHIIPFSRCLDNSFGNKTLCFIDENRNVKRNRTPFEAYGGQPDRWAEILGRVRRFQGQARRAKLYRFQMEEAVTDDFASRQLNDTRYAATLAKKYLGLLYGEEALRHVQVGRGEITWLLRNSWRLNRILGGEWKSRDDHRQHIVDAVVVALTDPAAVQALSRAASQAEKGGGRKPYANVPPPWEGFEGQVREAVLGTLVSHRVSRKVSGALHEETYYRQAGGEPVSYRARKKLEKLTAPEVEAIVDDRVRALVQEKLAALGETNPQKAFADPNNLPNLPNRGGRPMPIRKVRLAKTISAFSLGQGMRKRHVVSESNHHLEILETLNRRGQKQWEGALVPLHEAIRRFRAGEPVIRKDHGEGKRFLFTLAPGEIVELDHEGGRALFRVRSVSEGEIAYVSLSEARKKEEIKKSHQWKRGSANVLGKLNCRKVVVTPLGEVRRAHD
jgi:CRISPR-associated endonuclease Csn1